MQIVVAGCLAQKDRELVRRAGAATSTSCSAPTTSTAPPTCCTRPRDAGPDHRDPRGDRARRPRRRSPPRCRRGARCRTRPGSPSRSAATTPARSASCPPVRGTEISRPFDDIVAEVERLAADGVTEVTLLGQNVNSYGRDLAARRRARPAATGRVRPLFAELLRAVGAVDGIRRVRYTSPHPKDLRPETIAAMADDARRVRAPAPARCSRAATGCWPPCTAATPPSATSSGWPPPAPPSPDLAVTTDIIVGLPRRDRRRLRAHPRGRGRGRVRQRLHVHLLAPARHRGGRPVDELRRPPRSWPSASSGSGSWSSARRSPRTRPGSVGSRRSLVEGPSQQGPGRASAAAPRQNKLVHFRRLRRSAPGSYATVRGHRRRRPTTCAASCSRSPRRPRTRRACPCSSVDRGHRGALRRPRRRRPSCRTSWRELNERYADILAEDPDEPTDEDYLAEVTPAMVQAPHGTFLVAWLDGEPPACGAVTPPRRLDRTSGRSSACTPAPAGATPRRQPSAPRPPRGGGGGARLPAPPARDRLARSPRRWRSTRRTAGTASTPYGHYKDSAACRSASPRTSHPA